MVIQEGGARTNSAGDLKRRTSPREVVTFEPAAFAGGILLNAIYDFVLARKAG